MKTDICWVCMISMLMIVVMAKRYKILYKRENEDNAEKNISTIDLRGTLSKTFFLPGQNSGKNTVCSPLSVLMSLGKLALGAENDTLKELLLAIGISKKSKINKTFKPLLAELQYLDGGQLFIASRLYMKNTFHLNKDFVDQAEEIFNSSANRISFEYPTNTANQINTWVSRETYDAIRDIISPSNLTPLSSLLIINVVYFNGRWKGAFEDIGHKVFYTPAGVLTAPTMTRTGEYNYTISKALRAQIIQIPYMDEEVSFVIVLPTKIEAIDVLLYQLKLAPERLDSAMSNMTLTRVALSLPMFKIESQWNLKAPFEQAGVKQIFNEKDSNLTKIGTNGSVYVSSARHKAVIVVQRFGSKEDAPQTLPYQEPENFTANHPFLFFILVEKQQLLAGTLLYPHLY